MKRDRFAAEQIRSKRIDLGLSPEQLGWTVGVSGHTIRRIERDAVVPTPRIQFALARHFDLKPSDLWHSPLRAVVA